MGPKFTASLQNRSALFTIMTMWRPAIVIVRIICLFVCHMRIYPKMNSGVVASAKDKVLLERIQ